MVTQAPAECVPPPSIVGYTELPEGVPEGTPPPSFLINAEVLDEVQENVVPGCAYGWHFLEPGGPFPEPPATVATTPPSTVQVVGVPVAAELSTTDADFAVGMILVVAVVALLAGALLAWIWSRQPRQFGAGGE